MSLDAQHQRRLALIFCLCAAPTLTEHARQMHNMCFTCALLPLSSVRGSCAYARSFTLTEHTRQMHKMSLRDTTVTLTGQACQVQNMPPGYTASACSYCLVLLCSSYFNRARTQDAQHALWIHNLDKQVGFHDSRWPVR